MGQPLAPYVDPDSGLLVSALDVVQAIQLVDAMPCLVHLLPSFRHALLAKYKVNASDVYLSGSCPSGEDGSATNGLVLYR